MKAIATINGVEFTVDYRVLSGDFAGFNCRDDFYQIYIANERSINRIGWQAYESATLSASGMNPHGEIISITIHPKN